MTDVKLTLGKAIDQIIEALTSFDAKDRTAILGTVCSHLQINIGSSQSPAPQVPRQVEPVIAPRIEKPAMDGVDIKSLRNEKKPNSARQMACLVAYYLQEHAPEGERKNVVTTGDLEKYFKQAGYQLPKKMEQLLIDCKGSGYFENSKRGEYSLTRVGYNLVTHSMPAKGAA